MERGTDPSNVHPDPSPPDKPKYESNPELRQKIKHKLNSSFLEPKPRQYGIWPYLLIRAFLGDHGKRWPPLNNLWESPDIIVVEGVICPEEKTMTPSVTEA